VAKAIFLGARSAAKSVNKYGLNTRKKWKRVDKNVPPAKCELKMDYVRLNDAIKTNSGAVDWQTTSSISVNNLRNGSHFETLEWKWLREDSNLGMLGTNDCKHIIQQGVPSRLHN